MSTSASRIEPADIDARATATLPGAAAGTSRSLTPSPKQVWAEARGPVAVVALILVAALVLAVLGSGDAGDELDPQSAHREGSRALAEVLRREGVDVTLVTTTDAAVSAADSGSALLVTHSERLLESQLRRLESATDVILVDPTEAALRRLAPGVQLDGPGVGSPADRAPGCDLPAAVRAGTAHLDGPLYSARAPAGGTAVLCYPTGGAAALVVVQTPAHRVCVLGDPRPLTNEHIDESGNAALALGLLGMRDRLAWYLPSLADVPPGEQRSLLSLTPAGVRYGLLAGLVALVLLALWRARRLGPVVDEPLPVVVRSTETVEGRARLYRRARARGPAADILRRATSSRLARGLRLSGRSSPTEIVDAVCRATGRSPADVAGLLYGAAPADDDQLVRLARELNRLKREARPR